MSELLTRADLEALDRDDPIRPFRDRFAIPDGVDSDKIEANFKKGVLTVELPKKPEAQKPVKKIDVKTS